MQQSYIWCFLSICRFCYSSLLNYPHCSKQRMSGATKHSLQPLRPIAPPPLPLPPPLTAPSKEKEAVATLKFIPCTRYWERVVAMHHQKMSKSVYHTCRFFSHDRNITVHRESWIHLTCRNMHVTYVELLYVHNVNRWSTVVQNWDVFIFSWVAEYLWLPPRVNILWMSFLYLISNMFYFIYTR